ncbi:phospholipase D family protein [Meridianimarinicoccus sp. RP-17]|uniref:hypothetical protein n=1 Tax=Meridianimarinicoccus zhengii TaxID=2056810 RepID=UPI000DAE6473|nr:hypothetical protein [Phycocomes zhengii]
MRDRKEGGLISRFLSRPAARGPVAQEGTAERAFWADNAQRSVHDLVAEVLRAPSSLIVTGYQDFLSSLAIILDIVLDLDDRTPGSIRIVFGTNTETARNLGGGSRPVSEEARAYFLGAKGFSVQNLSDLRAIQALDGIERGIIQLRTYDPALAAEALGRAPAMLHAKLFVSDRSVLSGSANFSMGGLRRNLEFTDDVSGTPALAAARREAAEQFWLLGRDWTDSALEILRGLVRMVTPEDAVARTVQEVMGFTPWKVAGSTSAGRPPQPFQADLVYEAAGTIHEHGFAFVEAPTGAGKTDIGKHLAAVLPVSHDRTVFSWGERADQQRLGALALIPASVLGNWTRQAPSNFKAIKHSRLSRQGADAQAELDEINRSVQSAAAMIVDESHRLSSRYLAPSTRSIVFERSPAIWTACLSATLMGNQGLDGLLAFHERRASIFVPPRTTQRINGHMSKVRARGQLLRDRDALLRRIEDQARQEDLFDDADALRRQMDALERMVEVKGLELHALQAGLAGTLAPYVVRRQRACIGESAQRASATFAYPPIASHRCDAQLSGDQARIIDRIKVLAEAITTGTTLVSAEAKRASHSEIKFHDKSRIHIRNFLALLRASVTFAREEWARERDSDADQRGHASIGESLRRAERTARFRQAVPDGALPEETPDAGDDSPTPICDRIGKLLDNPLLDEIDAARADAMREILRKHGHAVFLAERVGVLETYARRLAARRGRGGPEVFVVAPGTKISGGKKLVHLNSGARAQEYFGIDGKHADPTAQRAMFMTFQMAEGINLQRASALGIIGVTSDVKCLIQGLGRIDRIDSPHAKIHYYTFDLPGLVLSSDKTARQRVQNIALLSGVGATDMPAEIVEFAAGDLTDLVLDQIRTPRILRDGNFYDLVESMRRAIPDDTLDRVRAARPRGLWGADLCMLQSTEPAIIVLLGGRTGGADGSSVLPPRLMAVRDRDDGTEIIGDQVEAARLLAGAYAETKRAGRHQTAPSFADFSNVLGRLQGPLADMVHWDIRPARTVSLLASLAEFLTGAPVDDAGRALLGTLTLPMLEKLAETWAVELDPFWITAKEAVSTQSGAGIEIPDYLGMAEVHGAFWGQSDAALAAIRQRMRDQVDAYRDIAGRQSIDVLDRVSVVFDAAPKQG